MSTSNRPLAHDVYLWQRAWSPSVQAALSEQGAQFRRVVVLAAEIDLKNGPHVAAFSPEYGLLPPSIRSIGLAVRIGPLPIASRAMEVDSPQSDAVRNLIEQVIATPRAAGIHVDELQIDFDCAESKLAAYATWVRSIKKSVAPLPIVITALPSWLKDAAFGELARDAGSFVLQVHSLHRPAGPDSPMTLCDCDEARSAVNRAAALDVPFRVALPTYTYIAGFRADGSLLGLSAEGPSPDWPANAILRRLSADPAQLAQLVRSWSVAHPSNMTGVIWFRLPTEDDALNWKAITLRAVKSGRVPQANLQVESQHSTDGLVDIFLHNIGDADASESCDIKLTWKGTGLVDSEALAGFERFKSEEDSVILHRLLMTPGPWIGAGEKMPVGWLKLSRDTEVHAHVLSDSLH